MMQKTRLVVLFALALTLMLGSAAQAQDEWKFGIGTGFSSFSLDGDIGFPVSKGGVILDVDLDNGDTSDLMESGVGLGGFARKGKWAILYKVSTVTLEDQGGMLEVEWDRTQVEAAAVYNFAKTGNHAWGVLVGARHIAHDWTFMYQGDTAEIDESWTDGLIGLTHAVPFGEKWSWANRVDAGFGGSEGSFLISSTINWHFHKNWSANMSVGTSSVEFGDEEDIGNEDFYLYDIDEPAVGLGIMFNW
jgi:hypothetical protein